MRSHDSPSKLKILRHLYVRGIIPIAYGDTYAFHSDLQPPFASDSAIEDVAVEMHERSPILFYQWVQHKLKRHC